MIGSISILFYKCGSREENRRVPRRTICTFQMRR